MNDDLPPALAHLLEGELAPGERLLWRGQPSLLHQIHFRIVLILCALLALVAVGGPIWIAHSTAFRELSRLSVISATPLKWFTGVVLLSAAFIPLVLWWVVRHTVYAITDRRAILIAEALLRRRVQSFTGEQLVRVVRHESHQGRGDILFERRVGFLGLTDAKAVEELLRQSYQASRLA
ncbi:MAG: hypothetical protein ABJF10_26865 [Chthoniobacter sp.]|uniref:hypothetical protein n=1 Tax=Chthoniobacter sp. TaxID=2510640 RepID=UPI0032A576CE